MTAKKAPHLAGVPFPAAVDVAAMRAIKAFAAGTASDGQQRAAYKWITEQACCINRDPFIADNARTTEYLIGRQSVARQILALVNERMDVEGG